MTPRELAEEGLRERLFEAVLAHTGVQPGWPHYDAGRVVVLVLDAIEPAIKAEFKAQAEEFRRLAAAELAQAKQMARVGPAKQLGTEIANDAWERGAAFGFRRAAQMLEEKLNG